jgi:two-component system phosphate regulon sensor histidine kinase PhoR
MVDSWWWIHDLPSTIQLMSSSFRTKVFVGSVAAAALSLAVGSSLLSWQVRREQRQAIEGRLANEARLIADLISAAPGVTPDELDADADRVAQYSESRVTFVADDGRVVGDSTQSPRELASLENHGSRPEVIAAREGAAGISQRFSTTVDADMLYVAVRASHPIVRYVRLALPLTDIDQQLATIRRMTLVALAAAVPVALLVSWFFSAPLARRVRSIAATANRYSAGDLTRPPADYGDDELGTVARVLDTSVQELGRRLEELSRDRARMEAILSGMVEGVLVVDRGGRVQLVNRAAQQMLKVDASATGRQYLEVIRHPDISAQLSATLRGEAAESCELPSTREPARTLVARAAPVSSSGGGGAVLVLHDITDLRRADQIRRDFVANVSHELRTPLTAIRGYVEALLDDPVDTESSRTFIEIIARHSSRMERLVTDLLRLARLDAHQEVLETSRCDMRQVFDAVVTDLASAIEARDQRITIDVAAEASHVHADPAKLHDVVRNLVENAVNYSPERSEIRLSTERTSDAVVIVVADSGPGIPPEDLSRVFERFYRVDKSRSRPGGTGLGLAIVKHLVELHGGAAEAANRSGGGAEFRISLPAAGGGV